MNNKIIIFIIILLLIIFITIFSMIYVRNNNYSGEDEYQKNRLKEGAHLHIYTTININPTIDFNNYIKFISEKIPLGIEDHFKNNNSLKNLILNNYIIEEEDFIEKLIVSTEDLWYEINKKNTKILHIKFNIERKRITILKDHRYFGGLFFLKIGGLLTNTKPVTIYNESYTPILSELLILYFGSDWMIRSFTQNSKIYVNPSINIKRINFKINFMNIPNNNKIRKQTLIMVEILNLLCNSLNIKNKKFNLLIPIAFESTSKNCNNVGGIFCQYKLSDTPKIFEKKLLSKKYHAVATNNLQKIISKGKKARNSIDIVFTLGCLISPTLESPTFIDNIMTSYLSVGDYPIYILSMTINHINFTTITIMTENINYESLKQNVYNNNFLTLIS